MLRPTEREGASGEGVEAYRVPRASTIISPLRAPACPDPRARPRSRRGVFIIFTRRYRYPIEPILIPRTDLSPLFVSLKFFSLGSETSLNCWRGRVGYDEGMRVYTDSSTRGRIGVTFYSAFLEIGSKGGPGSVSETFSIPWRRKLWNIACNLFFVRSPFPSLLFSSLFFSPRARFTLFFFLSLSRG